MLYDLNYEYELQREMRRRRMEEAEKDRLLRRLPRPEMSFPGRWLRSLLFFL
jgi:hypothetical protein